MKFVKWVADRKLGYGLWRRAKPRGRVSDEKKRLIECTSQFRSVTLLISLFEIAFGLHPIRRVESAAAK